MSKLKLNIQRIESLMAAKDIDKNALAASMGVSKRMVYYYFRGTKMPSFLSLATMAHILGTKMEDLIIMEER